MAETTTEMNKELNNASIMSMLTNTSSTTGTTKLNSIKNPKVGLVLKSSTLESYIMVLNDTKRFWLLLNKAYIKSCTK